MVDANACGLGDFSKLSPQDQFQVCIELAERAQKLGETAPAHQRLHFLEIASQWLHLAEANLRQ
jgi:hypothetical protein